MDFTQILNSRVKILFGASSENLSLVGMDEKTLLKQLKALQVAILLLSQQRVKKAVFCTSKSKVFLLSTLKVILFISLVFQSVSSPDPNSRSVHRNCASQTQNPRPWSPVAESYSILIILLERAIKTAHHQTRHQHTRWPLHSKILHFSLTRTHKRFHKSSLVNLCVCVCAFIALFCFWPARRYGISLLLPPIQMHSEHRLPLRLLHNYAQRDSISAAR